MAAALARTSLLLVLGLAGCNSQVGSLSITVVRSWDPLQEPLENKASVLAVRIDSPDGTVGPRTFRFGDRQGALELPLGKERRVSIDGLGPEGNAPVCRGRSSPLTIGEGDQAISLYMGRLAGKNGQFSYTPNFLGKRRAFHSATLLDDGSVLIAGGIADPWRPESGASVPQALRSTEMVDSHSLFFTQADITMASPRVGHTATLLSSGNVLIAGGSDVKAPVDAVEVYRPTEQTFLTGPALSQRRVWHAAATTERGVALVGGVDATGKLIYSSEAYDQGAPRPFPGLLQARRAFSLTRLTDGALLAIGGYDQNNEPLASTELIAPGSPAWTAGPQLSTARAHHSATLLHDGTVLVAGGLTTGGNATDTLERYNPATAQLLPLAEPLSVARWGHTATQLADKQLLIIGGFGATKDAAPVDTVESIQFFGGDLSNVNVTRMASVAELARAGHTATVLKSDWLLVVGGVAVVKNEPTVLDTAVVFVY